MDIETDSIEELAEGLNVTPVSARRMKSLWQLRKATYPGEAHGHARLDPANGPDSRIIDAMGWLEGGAKEGSLLTTPMVPVSGGAGRPLC